jgi:hypothetical protein
MDNKLKFFSGLLLGLTSTTAVYGDTTYPLLRGSDIDRLRGDVKKVGNDFNNVINRENAKEAYRQRQ